MKVKNDFMYWAQFPAIPVTDDDDEDDHDAAKVDKTKPETENKVQAGGEKNTNTTNNNNEEEEIYEWEYYYEDAELKKDDKEEVATIATTTIVKAATTVTTATTAAAVAAQPVKTVAATTAVLKPVTTTAGATAAQTVTTTTANIVQGWECPGCTFMNEPTRPGCAVCATDRPETDGAAANQPEVVKDGDGGEQQAPVVKVWTNHKARKRLLKPENVYNNRQYGIYSAIIFLWQRKKIQGLGGIMVLGDNFKNCSISIF